MSRIKRVNVRYGQIVFDLDDIDRIMEECWKIVRAAKKAELIYEKDKEAAEKQFRTEAAKHFEKAFGKGSCWKVFGTHYPSSTGYSAKRGTTFDTTQYKWVQEDIEKLTKEIEVAEREQDKLFATGKADRKSYRTRSIRSISVL